MNSQKVIALLLSTALSISTCVPLGNITALGAETGTAAEAVEVQEEVSDSAENAELPQEEEVSSEADTAEQTAVEEEDDTSDEQEAAVEETETAETENTENVTSETGGEDNESADEADRAETAQDAEEPQTSEESDSAAPEQAPAPAAETPAEDQTDLTAPAETETVKTDAQNGLVILDDFSNAKEIKVGDSHDVDITEEDGYVLYRFVPEEDGNYKFYSENEIGDPMVYLYLGDQTYFDLWDDSNPDIDRNFCVEYEFTKGETYYFQAGVCSDSGSYTVHLTTNDLYAEPVGDQERTVSPDDETILEVSATSSSEISYQWSLEGNTIENAVDSFYKIPKGESGRYTCLVTDEGGDSELIIFVIQIENNLRVYATDGEDYKTDWMDVYLAPDDSAVLKVIAEADDMEGLTYKWTDSDGNPVEGAGTTSCTVGSVSKEYHCTVFDKYGNSAYAVFNVTVQNNLQAYAIDEVDGQTDYVTVRLLPNASAELNVTVKADNMDELIYEWTDSDGNPVEGAGTKSCAIGPVTESKNYTFRVSDQYGNYATVYFYVRVNHLQAHTSDDDGETTWKQLNLAPNATAELSVTVNADDMTGLTYKWTDDDGNPVEGAGTTSCTIGPVTESKIYHFYVDDQYGNTANVRFEVNVNHLKVYAIDDEGEKTNDSVVKIKPNETAELNVTVTADDMTGLTYEWTDDDGNPVEGAGTKSCTVGPLAETANYTCHVRDQYGNSQYVFFYVRVNHLTVYAIDQDGNKVQDLEIYAAPNSTVELKANVTADDMSGLFYSWNYDEEDPCPATISHTVDVPVKGETWYTLSVSDRYGNTDYVYYIVHPLDYSGAETINVGDSVQVRTDQYDDLTLYKFTPTKTEECTLYATGQYSDSWVEVFDDSYKKLFYDYDSGDDWHFLLKEVFNAGSTYYFRPAGNSTKEGVDSFTMHLEASATDISQASVTGIVNRTYNGAAQTQAPVVKLGSTALAAGTDYTVSYSNNVNAGTATMTITGQGKYTGTVSKTFNIAKAAQSFSVSGSPSVESGKTTKINAAGAKETSTYYFVSSNTAVAAVAGDGTVTGKNPGTASITISTPATANYNSATWTVTINVIKNLKKPGYCHFVKWNNKNYTGCRIAWNRAVGAEGYQTQLCWTNGSHESITYVGPNTLYRDCKVYANHVSLMRVRAFYNFNGQRIYGPWSNMEFITPSPTKLTCKNVSAGKDLKMKVNWPIIYGSNGYNVFITTNPNGKWSWNQSTAVKANALSAVITKYQGKELKKNTRYYVRIVTRRKFKGVFCSVPMPAKNTYVGSFIIK